MNRRSFLKFSTAAGFAEAMALRAFPFSPQSSAKEQASFRSALERLEAMTQAPVTNWKTHADDMPHPEDPILDDSAWAVYKPPRVANVSAHGIDGRRYPEAVVGDGRVWFRSRVETPRTMGGHRIEGLPLRLNVKVFFGDFMSQQASVGRIRVFTDGTMVEMAPARIQQPIILTQSAKPGRTFLIAAYSPVPGGLYARLEVEHPLSRSNPDTLLQEILCVQAASRGFAEGQRERNDQLLSAVRAIDFAALDKGDQEVFDRSLAEADRRMQPLARWIRQFTIRAVGNAHIDMDYLWPPSETVEVVRDTFETVLELINEYPRLTFAQSSVQDYYWLERYYPPEFAEIKKRAQEGRWEVVGGMWVEPDLNMPCGESIVRQLLTGKRYLQKALGVDVKIGWNPDSFGYSWQLPQIYKKSGIDHFITQKLSWNDTTKFPHNLFWWEGPDGSRILTYFPHHYVNEINTVAASRYIAEDTALCSGYKEQLLLFGLGDHGGGPTRQMLDASERWRNSPQAAFPNFEFSTTKQYFDRIHRSLENSTLEIPTWKDELYLETHRGTYTTEAEAKRRMRRSEALMLNAEKFCSLAMLHGRAYPRPVFEDCWRRVCFEQFHDLLTGCQIHINYDELAEDLEFVEGAVRPQLEESMRLLAARIDTRGPGRPVVVFNPLSWERTDVAEVEVQLPEQAAGIDVSDADEHAVPFDVIEHDRTVHSFRIRFLAKSVPATGYKVFRVVPAEGSRKAESTLRAAGTRIENEFLLVEVDPKTGCLSKLICKKDGRNILAAGALANSLQIFDDNPKTFDCCNLGWPYQASKVELLQPDSVELVEKTAVRAVIRVKKRYQGSSFIQDICLYPGIARADVHMHADWHEQHKVLKVAFPLDVTPDAAAYEIPYGVINRPATYSLTGKPDTPENRAAAAKYEVCALQWGDLSDGRRGFSLLNDCKYGYDTVEKGTLRLTLLRAPESPVPSKDPDDLFADQGPHDFTYSMYPHAGDWKEAGTQRRGYELNYPLLPLAVDAHAGPLPALHSLVRIEPANVILTAIKKAEDDNGLIFRFYEFEGSAAEVRLVFTETAERAVETDLMEKEEHPVNLTEGGREVRMRVGHHEIKSLKVVFPHAVGSVPKRRV